MVKTSIIQTSRIYFWKQKITNLITSYNRISLNEKLQKEDIFEQLKNKDISYHMITYFNILSKFEDIVSIEIERK